MSSINEESITLASESRRAVLKASLGGVALASSAMTSTLLTGPAHAATSAAAAPATIQGKRAVGPVVFDADTTMGRVRGMASAGIKSFKGIPYGADTGGVNRFMPPRKPKPWAGTRNCIGYTPVSPQTPADLRSDYSMMIMWDRHVGVGGMGENCLSLNVWTPAVHDNGKRAVLVSYHGGGWATGSGNGPMYDGSQLARLGDVVVVTVNHRLASFGYVDLVSAGAPEEFKHAGVCGVMDMVAALEWVRDNIASFGGDPARVMVFGQSGGGAKTSTLLATPAAKGLFHRAAVQSGSALRLTTKENAARAAEQYVKKLGLARNRIADIQKLPWEQLLEAQADINPGFSPVIGDSYLPHHPFDPVAPPESRDVPVIISTTLEDAAIRLTNFDLDDAGLTAILNERFKGKASEMLPLYRAASPKKTPYLIQAQAFTDSVQRRRAVTQAERKTAQGGASVWMYQWDWCTPAFDGKFGAIHGHDVDASFYLYRNAMCGSGTKEGMTMAKRFASTWVAFAKTGNPNNELIPNWPTYDATKRATMIFDNDTRVVNDPRADIRKFWDKNAPSET
jgi:para-nitrobenzyl esterase